MSRQTAKSPLYRSPPTHPWNVEHRHCLASSVTRNGAWATKADVASMGAQLIISDVPGDYVETKFCGAGLWAYMRKGDDAGMVNIEVDGIQTVTDLDLYRSSALRVPVWLAVDLETTDVNGKSIVHTCRITISTSHNVASTGFAIRIEGFEVEVEAGALQVLAFIEQDVVTTTVPPPPSVTFVESQAMGTLGTAAPELGKAVTANTTFLSVPISLAAAASIKFAAYAIINGAGNWKVRRDGIQIGTGAIAANTWTAIPVVDTSVGAGNRIYTLEFNINGVAVAVAMVIAGDMTESHVLVSGSSSIYLQSYNGQSNSVSKSITLAKVANVDALILYLAWYGGQYGVYVTGVLKRDGTTIDSRTLADPAHPTVFSSYVVTDTSVSAAAHTYEFTMSLTSPVGMNCLCAIILISNGG